MTIFEKIKKGAVDLVTFMENVKDPSKEKVCNSTLNLFDEFATTLKKSNQRNQKLEDEINKLKGEQGKPDVKANKKKNGDDDDNNPPSDHSSEDERNKGNKNKKEKKAKRTNKDIKIDEVIKIEISQEDLPTDVIFKGFQSHVFQDIKIITKNIKFEKGVYYSPSQKKTFVADLPKGYHKHGHFAPALCALVLSLNNDAEMTQPKIHSFLETMGILISKSSISRMLIDDHEPFHQEKEDIFKAGLESTTYQHFDDTHARVNGQNQHCHVLCNEYYTFYQTYPKKDRLTVLDVLTPDELIFSLEEESFLLMEQMNLAKKHLSTIKKKQGEFREIEIDAILNELFPNPKKRSKIHTIIKDAAAIVAYRKRDDSILHLVVDDAPQFKKIAKIALCWIHEGRHYKKINPLLEAHQLKVAAFLERFWGYYHELKDYKENPTESLKKELECKFDLLFSTKTGYDVLDDRIALTAAKKDELLLVLEHPEIPLHNNPAELAARVQARKRDIHLYTKNEKGTRAKDTFATIVDTARKLKVNVYHYFIDRLSGKNEMPSLAELIKERSLAAKMSP